MPGARNRAGKRKITTFSLSFLDIMACGFGAVTLLFLLLKHDASAVDNANPNLSAEINLLHEDIRIGQENLVALRNSLAAVDTALVDAQGLSTRVLEDIDQTQREISAQKDPENEIALLRKQVEELERETSELRDEGRGDDLRRFIGQGDRQYLTGLKLGGNRIMILLDASASMLSDSIVNVIRRRNMSDSVKRQSEKWLRGLKTAEWLVAQLPPESRFQIYTFNTTAKPALKGTENQWLDVADDHQIEQMMARLSNTTPEGGTSLINAFTAINAFERGPDNLFIITDGLPTQGATKPKDATVSGRDRANLFDNAVVTLPRQLPVNVILLPMEGDPAAAARFWQLALRSKGAFLSPSRDWP